MIAVDTSSLIAFFLGEKGEDVEAVDMAFAQKRAVLPPVVLSELFSSPTLSRELQAILNQLPVLSIIEGYWQRAGLLRAKTISRGSKARLADCLIAQSCLDHEVMLITRDSDFKRFVADVKLHITP